MSTGEDPIVRLDSVYKCYGKFVALDGIDLDVQRGEFLTLLGPSGCGKTTTLRTISGFELPTRGDVYLDGARITDVPAYRRRVNTVFQSYALFPHMSVVDNVAYGLRFDGVGRQERRVRAAAMLDRVGLGDRVDHRPDALSGGQMQRVALARALIKEPAVLLLDEPLSALDARLRKEMQMELKRTQRETGITFVYVTHDQEEALVMSDRIAVMNQGRIQQLGTPDEVFEKPSSLFVAKFIGASNEIDGVVADRGDAGDGGIPVTLDTGETIIARADGARDVTGAVRLIIRPEQVHLVTDSDESGSRLRVVLEDIVYLGAWRKAVLRRTNGTRIDAVMPASRLPENSASRVGGEVEITLARKALHIYPNPDRGE